MTAIQPLRSFVPDTRPGSRSLPPVQGGRREPYPARAPGVGYGNSSGYANSSQPRYAREWNGAPRFKCAG